MFSFRLDPGCRDSCPCPHRAELALFPLCSHNSGGWSWCRAFQEMCWCELVNLEIFYPQILGDLVLS